MHPSDVRLDHTKLGYTELAVGPLASVRLQYTIAKMEMLVPQKKAFVGKHQATTIEFTGNLKMRLLRMVGHTLSSVCPIVANDTLEFAVVVMVTFVLRQ